VKTRLANRLWLHSQRSNYRRFVRDRNDLERIQRHKMFNYLEQNQDSAFGRYYNFQRITSYSDFQKSVPVVEKFQQVQPYIHRMMQGENDVLFKGRTLFFESTSGSSGVAKYIPYNTLLKIELDKAISAWMWNLYRMDPKIFSGKAYWSLSPAMKKENPIDSVIPIGTTSDTDYFNPLSALLLRQIMAVNRISSDQESNSFYTETWRQLLKQRDLTFISVWSPQFLLRLIGFLQVHREEIFSSLKCSQREIKAIEIITGKDGFQLQDLFPNLRLVSCWTQAQSAMWYEELAALCTNIPIQGKGLLSTEGVVTIPWGMDEHVLSYHSHFYEFRSRNGEVLLSHQVEKGEEYECIMTTGGGLYRYNTHDCIKCTGFFASVPTFEFVGRSGNVSDMVGEKVNEQGLIEEFMKIKKAIPDIHYLFLFPHKVGNEAEYCLLTNDVSASAAEYIRKNLKEYLSQNPYYRQAVDAGQLSPLSVYTAEKETVEMVTRFYQRRRQIKDGDLKLPVLFPLGFWKDLQDAGIIRKNE